MRAAVEAAWLVIGLDDDLYSYPKERWWTRRTGRDATLELSAIPILMRDHRCPERQAVQLLRRP